MVDPFPADLTQATAESLGLAGISDARSHARGVELRESLRSLQSRTREQRAAAEQEAERLQEFRQERDDAQDAFEELRDDVESHPLGRLGQSAETMARLAGLEATMEAAKQEFERQEKLAKEEHAKYVRLQHQVDVSERQMARVQGLLEDTAHHMEDTAKGDRRRAKAARSGAKRTAAVYKDMQEKRASSRAIQEDLAKNLAAKQVQVAQRLRPPATRRVAASRKVFSAARRRMVATKEQEHKDRTDAVLQLRADTDAAFDRIKGAYEKRLHREREKEAAHDKEYQALLRRGKNPYEVWRKRDIKDKEFASERKQLERICAQKMELAKEMAAEAQYNKKLDDAELLEKQYEKKHREALGRHLTEQRIAEFIRHRTKDGREVVDPSGKMFKIAPSQVTTIRDASFGLGYNPNQGRENKRAITDLVASSFGGRIAAGYGEYERLLPKQEGGQDDAAARDDGEPGDPDDEASKTKADIQPFLSPRVEPPGRALATKTGVLPGNSLQSLEDRPNEDGDASDADGSLTKPSPSAKNARGPSRFEQQALERARQRQRDRLEEGEQQVAGGKQFNGSAFLFKPAVLRFEDFEVGETYHAKVHITNTSLSFNAFTTMPLDIDVRDYFDVAYEKPGRMSAGMSCEIRITFTPKVNEDVFTQLQCRGKTGAFALPIQCGIRRMVPVVTPRILDFESVVLGESILKSVRIQNEGALPMEYEIVDAFTGEAFGQPVVVSSRTIDASDKREKHESDALSEAVLIEQARSESSLCLNYEPGDPGPYRCAAKGKVSGYSEVSHAITFAPLQESLFDEDDDRCRHRLLVRFRAQQRCARSSGTETVKKEIALEVVGKGLPTPIYVQDDFQDFGCCVFGKLYRKQIVLCNRGRIAYKVLFSTPPMLKSALSFNPDMGFIQPKSTFRVNLKYTPDDAVLRQVGRFALPEKGLLVVPVQIVAPEQRLPIFFTLRSQLTCGHLQICYKEEDCKMLDFGEVYVSQSASIQITLRNPSLLPQKFGFVNLPRELRVDPHDGFGVLLPGEATDATVTFSPSSRTTYDMVLHLRSNLLAHQRVRVSAKGIVCPVQIQDTVLHMSPTYPGDACIESIFVKNVTKTPQLLRARVPLPRLSYLSISPFNLVLPPLGSGRLEVMYKAPKEEDPALLIAPKKKEQSVSTEEEDASKQAETASDEDKKQNGSKKKLGQSPKTSSKKGKKAKADAKAIAAAEEEEKTAKAIEEKAKAKASTLSPAAKFLKFRADAESLIPISQGKVTYSASREYRVAEKSFREESADCAQESNDPTYVEETETDEPWSRHGHWRIPISVEEAEDGEGNLDGRRESGPRIALEIYTTTVKRLLVSDVESLPFGQLPVGSEKVIPLKLTNRSDVIVPLRAYGFSATGPFSIVNAVRDLPSHGSITILVRFNPVASGSRMETLICEAPTIGKVLRFCVSGQGVRPSIMLHPESGILDFGSLLVGTRRRETIRIENTSSFALDFHISERDPQPLRNLNGLDVFGITPSTATVAAGEIKEVVIEFRADQARFWPYHGEYNVSIRSGVKEDTASESHILCLHGRAWEKQLYVRADDFHEEGFAQIPESLREPLHAKLDDDTAALDSEIQPSGIGVHEPPRLTLQFPKLSLEDFSDPSSLSRTRKFHVGCIQGDGGGGGGTFDVSLEGGNPLADLFKLSSDKGSVAPGNETAIAVTYTPTVRDDVGGLDVGQWIDVPMAVNLKGGASDMTVPVVLRAYHRI